MIYDQTTEKVILFLLIGLLLSLVLIIKNFIIKPIKDSKKFRIYEVRDELARIAMRGYVDENSEEYKQLIYIMNIQLQQYEEDFSITDHIKALANLSNRNRTSLRATLYNINSNKYLEPIAKKVYKNFLKQFTIRRKLANALIFSLIPLVFIIKKYFSININQDQVGYRSMINRNNKYRELIKKVA